MRTRIIASLVYGLLGCVLLASCGGGGAHFAPTPQGCVAAAAVPQTGSYEDYTLALLNAFRSCGNPAPPPLSRDTAPGAPLDAYARLSAMDLLSTGGIPPNAYWTANPYPAPYTNNKGLENQGMVLGGGGSATEYDIILALLTAMYQQGPGGTHHDVMMDPSYTRVGIGVILLLPVPSGKRVLLSNDFTDL